MIDSGNVSFISKNSYKNQMMSSSGMQQIKYSNLKNDILMPLCHLKGNNMWILKPTNLNCGKGIHVVSSFKKIKRLIRDYCHGKEQPVSSPPV
jgi:phosphoribosylamine-glycine ligase